MMAELTNTTRPRLAAKARLKLDKKTGRFLLLYPEAGLELNRTGAEILELCDGVRSLGEIAETLVKRYPDKPREAIEGEVRGFLKALTDRALLRTVE